MKSIHTFNQILRCLVLILIVTFFVSMISNSLMAQSWPPPLGKDKIVYLVGPWDTGASISHVAKILLEKIGYKVELKLVETGLAYQALASGSGDVWSSGYLPGQHPYLIKHKDKINILAMSYMPVYDGFIVPDYMPISQIGELKDPKIKKLLAGKIIGIDAGSGTMLRAEKAMKTYNIDYELISGSTPAMEAAFAAAYEKKKPIVVVGWCPTAMCAEYGVVILKEPKRIMVSSQDFHIVRNGFRHDSPRAATLLSRITMYEDQISECVLKIRKEGKKAEVAAQEWIDENPELVWFWAGDLTSDFPMPPNLK